MVSDGVDLMSCGAYSTPDSRIDILRQISVSGLFFERAPRKLLHLPGSSSVVVFSFPHFHEVVELLICLY